MKAAAPLATDDRSPVRAAASSGPRCSPHRARIAVRPPTKHAARVAAHALCEVCRGVFILCGMSVSYGGVVDPADALAPDGLDVRAEVRATTADLADHHVDQFEIGRAHV